jgi:hypothetical protein
MVQVVEGKKEKKKKKKRKKKKKKKVLHWSGHCGPQTWRMGLRREDMGRVWRRKWYGGLW